MNVVLKMKVVLNMKEFQLPRLLEALGGGTARVENIVINAKEIEAKEEELKKEQKEEIKEEIEEEHKEEFKEVQKEEIKEQQKEEVKNEHRDLTTDDLLRIQEFMNRDGNGKDLISKKAPGID